MTLAMRPRGRREGERGDQELRIAAVDSECVERQLEENRREGAAGWWKPVLDIVQVAPSAARFSR